MVRDNWRKRIQTDRSAFVWHVGVLRFGLLFGLAVSIIVWFNKDWANHSFGENLLKCLGFLILGPIVGFLWGHLFWWVMNCQKSTDHQSLPEEREGITD